MPTTTRYYEVDSIYTPEQKLRRIEKIKRRVQVDDNGCWIYTGRANIGGYGIIRFGNRPWAAHRLMYAMTKGSIPPGMFVCHSCDVRRCINPEHLWLGTAKQNSLDCASKGRVHGQTMTKCKRGHDLTEDNVYRHGGRRHCLTCVAIRGRQYQDKQIAKRRLRGRKPRPVIKHPLHVMQVGETYRPENPTKYFRRIVWNSAARLRRKFEIKRDGETFLVTRVA